MKKNFMHYKIIFIPTDGFKCPVHTEYGKKWSVRLSWLKDHKMVSIEMGHTVGNVPFLVPQLGIIS